MRRTRPAAAIDPREVAFRALGSRRDLTLISLAEISALAAFTQSAAAALQDIADAAKMAEDMGGCLSPQSLLDFLVPALATGDHPHDGPSPQNQNPGDQPAGAPVPA